LSTRDAIWKKTPRKRRARKIRPNSQNALNKQNGEPYGIVVFLPILTRAAPKTLFENRADKKGKKDEKNFRLPPCDARLFMYIGILNGISSKRRVRRPAFGRRRGGRKHTRLVKKHV
jgi:hypothetical protein